MESVVVPKLRYFFRRPTYFVFYSRSRDAFRNRNSANPERVARTRDESSQAAQRNAKRELEVLRSGSGFPDTGVLLTLGAVFTTAHTRAGPTDPSLQPLLRYARTDTRQWITQLPTILLSGPDGASSRGLPGLRQSVIGKENNRETEKINVRRRLTSYSRQSDFGKISSKKKKKTKERLKKTRDSC